MPKGVFLKRFRETLSTPRLRRPIFGVRPHLLAEIQEDIIREKDGPMLVHGLQGLQGSQILIPTRRNLQPDRDFLAERYEIVRKAG